MMKNLWDIVVRLHTEILFSLRELTHKLNWIDIVYEKTIANWLEINAIERENCF